MSKRFTLLSAASFILLNMIAAEYFGFDRLSHDFATAGLVLMWFGIAER